MPSSPPLHRSRRGEFTLFGSGYAGLGLGAGAETNAPLAVAVIGGMITSTLLTLVVVPAAYSLVENWRARRGARTAGGAAALESPQAPEDRL